MSRERNAVEAQVFASEDRGSVLVVDAHPGGPSFDVPGVAVHATAREALARIERGERFALVVLASATPRTHRDLRDAIARIAPEQAARVACLLAPPEPSPSLPDLGPPSSAFALREARPPSDPAPSRPSLERATGVVIVADDDPSARKLMVRWLTRAGFTCLELASGQDAIDAVLADPDRVDALVLDVNMPGLSGFGVLARLRADAVAGGVPIIMVTAQEIDEADVARGVRAGAGDYLTKPSAGTLLVAKVRAACERSRAERELRARLESAEADANSDPLTRLMNRRAFDGRLVECVAHATRHREPLALVLIDVDHFKAVNDEFGHIGGDRMLLHFAWGLRRSIRVGDQPFRLGGDEFALLLPKCDAEGALQVTARLRNELHADPITLFGGKSSTIPFSAGVATAETKNLFQVLDLVARADAALYAAKNGRAGSHGGERVAGWTCSSSFAGCSLARASCLTGTAICGTRRSSRCTSSPTG